MAAILTVGKSPVPGPAAALGSGPWILARAGCRRLGVAPYALFRRVLLGEVRHRVAHGFLEFNSEDIDRLVRARLAEEQGLASEMPGSDDVTFNDARNRPRPQDFGPEGVACVP